jgi:hypothetical protein
MVLSTKKSILKFKFEIKFARFAGEEFPPYIVFKIYSKTHNSQQAKYINGKNTITTSSSVNITKIDFGHKM